MDEGSIYHYFVLYIRLGGRVSGLEAEAGSVVVVVVMMVVTVHGGDGVVFSWVRNCMGYNIHLLIYVT